jgi:hypothetical protein
MTKTAVPKHLFDPKLDASARVIDALAARLGVQTRPRPLRRKLDLAFENALRNRPCARGHLRTLIRLVVRRGSEIGEPPSILAEVLIDFFAKHPKRTELDKLSWVDGSRSSDRLLNDVRQWIAEPGSRVVSSWNSPRSLANATAPRGPRAVGEADPIGRRPPGATSDDSALRQPQT